MIAFIDDQRAVHGVEPICKVLPIAPSTYHAHEAQRRDPLRLSARARRDLALRVEVQRVFDANYRVYGVRKVWRQLQRDGFDVARCTVARLMRVMSLAGVIRGRPMRTKKLWSCRTLSLQTFGNSLFLSGANSGVFNVSISNFWR